MSTQRGYIQLHIKHLSELQMFFLVCCKTPKCQKNRAVFPATTKKRAGCLFSNGQCQMARRRELLLYPLYYYFGSSEGLKKPGFGSF